MSRSPTYSDCESPPQPRQRVEQSAHPPQSDGGGGERLTLPGARCHPRPQKRNRGRPAPDTPRSRPGSPPPVSDRSPEAPTAAVGGGAGPHPDRRSPHYGAAAPGRMRTSHRSGTLGTPRPCAPMPSSGRAPPPPRAPRVLSGIAGPSKPNSGSPTGPTPAPRVLPGCPPRGGGVAGVPRVGAASPAPRPSHSRGRKQGAGGGGSRSPWGVGAPGYRAWAPDPPPPPGDQNGAMSSPTGQKQAARGGGGRLPGPGRAEPPPGSSGGDPSRPAAQRRAEGSGGRLRAASHLCPEWVAAHGPGSAVSGRRQRWRRG